jgi:hypothetical protein
MKRLVIVLALSLAAVLAAVPASATDFHGRGVRAPQTSVFPTPRDPWRSWGDARHDHALRPHRERHPHGHHHWDHHPHAHSHFVVPPPAVWVPGRWVWNGAAWAWWPGHWR